MKRLLTLLCILVSASVSGQVWLRGVAIAPDGRDIAFTYKGDIYLVPATGGTARPLTSDPAFDGYPRWSPDGRQLAFASARYGGLCVMVVPREGGVARRLTTHSNQEIPVAWADTATVLFSRAGTPTVQDMAFPSNTFKHIYKVRARGGRPTLWSELTMGDVSVNPSGDVLYDDIKGYEDPFRKHHRSPMARDIWQRHGDRYTRLTTFEGEDRNPVWAADGKSFYYLSERDGTMNVYRGDTPLTHFTLNPVRFLTATRDNLLCFLHDGRIYTLREGEAPREVPVNIIDDKQLSDVERATATSGASAVCVSPKGKEVAFILNGDVYVTSTDYKTTRQITATPERERTVSFSADGRTLVYDSERDGRWSIFTTTIVNKDEKQFAYATELRETRLTDPAVTSFQPAFSPDGKRIAYLARRTELRVMDADGGHDHVVMPDTLQYSYSDGDQHFAWSPDSRHLLTEYIGHGGWNLTDVALADADGREPLVNLTQSGYDEGAARWALGGKAILFQSDREGLRAHGSWGAQRDVYITFLDREAYERFLMTKEEAERDPADTTKKDKHWQPDLTDLPARTLRLTPASGSISDAVLSPDGTKLYYIAYYNGAAGLWVNDLREHKNELRLRGVSGGNLSLTPDGKTAYMGNGAITRIDLNACQTKDIPFEAFTTRHPARQYAYLLEHIWQQTREKLYDPQMNGANWDSLHAVYRRYLPYINNGYDFAEMASEMLGELNVSHTGCRYGGTGVRLTTASLGVILDDTYEGDGLRIEEVIAGSPLYTCRKAQAGDIITHIDGTEIRAGEDYFPLLAGKAGRATRLTIRPRKGKAEDVVIRPLTFGGEQELLYTRWVRRNERLVDSLSRGQVGYVHIEAMNGESFHTLYREALSEKNRQRRALIVDTRHNGGGWLHNDVCQLLSGRTTMRYEPRGQFIGNDPFDRWTKPSCMLTCEDNYSNAHGTPWLYKELGIGPLIGAPVAGTMTAVWWETIGGFTFGIPQVGARDPRGQYLENQTLLPNLLVLNTPEQQLAGEDKQIEAAVREMMK